MAFEASYIYRIKDQYSSILSRITKYQSQFNSKLKESVKDVEKLKSNVNRFRKASLALGAGVSVVSTVTMKKFVDAAKMTEDQVADVTRVMDLGGKKGIKKYQKEIRPLAHAVGVASGEFASMAFEIKKATKGLTVEGVNKVTQEVVKMAAAWGMMESEAVAVYGSIQSKTAYSTKQMKILTGSINFMGDETAGQVRNIAEIIARQPVIFGRFEAGVAAAWGTITDIYSTSAEVGATAFKMMTNRMKMMGGDMAELLVKDQSAAILKVLDGFNSIEEEGKRSVAIFEAFGSEAAPFVESLAKNIDNVREVLSKTNKDKAIKSIDEEFEKLRKRALYTEKTFTKIKFDVFSKFGEGLLPIYTTILSVLSELGTAFLNFVDKYPKMGPIISSSLLVTTALGALLIVATLATYAIKEMKLATYAILVIQKAWAVAIWILKLPLMVYNALLHSTTIRLMALSAQMVWASIKARAIAIGIKVITAAQWLWNAAMSANPIGLIIIGIGALIGLVVLLVKNWKRIKEAMSKFWAWIEEKFPWMGKAVDWVVEKWNTFKDAVLSFWEAIKNSKLVKWLGKLFSGEDTTITLLDKTERPDERAPGPEPRTPLRNRAVEEAATRAVPVGLYGGIRVAAEPGTKVTESKIYSGNNGRNMAFSGRW